jgi:ribosome maturation factor RimP
MAFDVDRIRATGQRVAASHGLDVVEIEFSGGAKHRTLRVFIEKNAEERRKLWEQAESAGDSGASSNPHLKSEVGGTQAEVGGEPTSANSGQSHSAHPPGGFAQARSWGTQGRGGMEQLSGVTHEDCATFSRDFGTVLDVEDLIPGGEYTLEVSSPGLDRKLKGIEDYRRFLGLLAKVQTFEPVEGNRHWQGRLHDVTNASVKLVLERKGGGPKKKSSELRAQSSGKAGPSEVEIALKNIEKAQLVPEF